MELQVSLLSSDLEHLATNFRLLSKEFLILQDFVRQQYGMYNFEFKVLRCLNVEDKIQFAACMQ